MALEFIDLGLARDQVEYLRAWDLQREIHTEVVAGNRPDTVLLLEHAPIYTAGRRTTPEELPTDGSRVVEVDRGGKITWHGPGQLVAYPLIQLPESIRVVDYVRRLEEAMIRTFGEFGLNTGRVDGRSGVWLGADGHRPERKIAAIGVKVSSGVSMHGLAMNITNPLNVFDSIIPCGISDAGVTNLMTETGEAPGLLEIADILCPQLEDLLAWYPFQKSADVGQPVLKRPDTLSAEAIGHPATATYSPAHGQSESGPQTSAQAG